MLRRQQSWNQREEVNCGPRLEVITEGTPNREIQVWMRAVAQTAAAVEERGMASGQRVVWSMMVRS